jgi:hypothetical protein
MAISLIMDCAMALLLVATIIYCAILNHRLIGLRADSARLKSLISGLGTASSHAEQAVGELKVAAAESGRDLQGTIDRAVTLKADIAYLIDRGAGVADRLEASSRIARDPRREMEEGSSGTPQDATRQTRADAKPLEATRTRRPAEPATERSYYGRAPDRPGAVRPTVERPAIERPAIERPATERPAAERPGVSGPAERPGPGLAFLLQQATEAASGGRREMLDEHAEPDPAPPGHRGTSRAEQELRKALLGRR